MSLSYPPRQRASSLTLKKNYLFLFIYLFHFFSTCTDRLRAWHVPMSCTASSLRFRELSITFTFACINSLRPQTWDPEPSIPSGFPRLAAILYTPMTLSRFYRHINSARSVIKFFLCLTRAVPFAEFCIFFLFVVRWSLLLFLIFIIEYGFINIG